MKVLVFVKATPNSEKGLPPAEQMQEMFAAMGKFNEELVKAGILKEADGLKPSSAAKRITFSDSGSTSVIDGPFAETKELVAGYWVWDVKSMDEAVSWGKRCPNPMPGEEGVLEIRPTYTMEDFGELMPDDHRERVEQMRKQVLKKPKAKKAKSKSKKAPPRKKSKAGRAKSKK